ncbi:transcriptional regulator [Streptomyces sp. NBC_00237]|uniref:transcriptional regulator n=1 Tax=Streptomyces sp. NBC_00237 TaxID=2975687 RepID=UPI00224D7729|nr:transcriptional regulator [Streptomyces sp. NBC_00237]MCX5207668.1 transcriptional regulator [Streptomyces sp. NBC_00237]
MGRPAQERRPNGLLAHWLLRTGMSNVELARAVTVAAADRGERGITPDESRVRRWLKGEMPRPPVPALLAEVLSARAGLPLICSDLGFPGPHGVAGARHLDLPWEVTCTIGALAEITRSEFMLPTSHTTDEAHSVRAGEDLLAPLQRWPSTAPTSEEPSPLQAVGQRIGTVQVEGIRAVTATFRDLDNRHGGALSRKAVIGQLNDAVTLLDTGMYTAATGKALFSAVADLGSVAAWMTFDAGRHASAQRLFITALHAAAEGEDRAIGAHLLQCKARQMSHLEHFDDALDLVALAQYGARRHLTPATTSVLASLEARFHAILGNLNDSERAADQAQDAFTRITSEEPAHLAFFDAAELSATLGIAHQIAAKNSTGDARTRRAEKSVLLIHQALEHRPEHRVRSKAFDHLGLARTHLTIGETDGALWRPSGPSPCSARSPPSASRAAWSNSTTKPRRSATDRPAANSASSSPPP